PHDGQKATAAPPEGSAAASCRCRLLLGPLAAAEGDSNGDGDELRRAPAFLNAHVPDFGEEARRPGTKGRTAPEIPRELGLGRVDGSTRARGLDLHVVNAAAREQVGLHDRRGYGNFIHEIGDPADELRVPGN